MAKILGIGGVFFKAGDRPVLTRWYREVLGVDLGSWGAFFSPAAMAAHPGAGTALSLFAQDTDYFSPSPKPFMINFAVDDLEGVLTRCREHGVEAVQTIADEANGRFAHLIDPEGNKIELWQPKPMAL